jgi:hypothetical protein
MNLTPMRTVGAATLAIGMLLCGCATNSPPPSSGSQGGTSTARSSIPLDLSTPDKALKSYWAVRDATRAEWAASPRGQQDQIRATERQMPAVVTAAFGDQVEYFSSGPINPQEVLVRDILEVNAETESRAVAVAVIKNISPIPVGAQMTDFDKRLREDGNTYKYVLEKDESGWRVAEIWHWSDIGAKKWQRLVPF